MNKNELTKFLTCLLVCTLACFMYETKAMPPKQVERYLLSLDSVIDHHEIYEREFEEGVTRLKQEISSATDDEQKYQLRQMLGIMYSSFMADSALYYLQLNEDYAHKEQRTDYLNEIHLGRARLYTSIGLLAEAQTEIDQIDLTGMPEGFVSYYYVIRLHMVIQKNRLTGEQLTDDDTRHLADMLKLHAQPDDKMSQAQLVLWSYEAPDRPQKLAAAYEALFEESLRTKNLNAVHAAYMLSGAYGSMGDDEQALKYLCLASETAVKLCDRDRSALIDLITYLVNQEDYERAYSYIHFVIESQTYYPDHARALQIAQYMELLSTEMQRISQKQQNTILTYLWVLIGAFGVLCLLTGGLLLLYRRLRRQKAEISAINQQLCDSNLHIQQINHQLNEANFIKEAYIAGLFSNCAHYLNMMEDYRADINRKAKAGKNDEVLQITAPENTFIHQEAKELNRSFDETFLSIYPNFVADLNTLLSEDGQLTAKDNCLSTELRIYALIWLGFNNGSKIAHLLHVTPKTVYNAIVRVRSKAKDPTLTADQFNAAVCALGRNNINS